jgi:DtxR family transcriptional regulator, Mn-dependent transcriptional regulator
VSDLIDTTEMYLRTIYELEEEGIVALRARIAERLGHSGPTVSQTVARMERDGLLHLSGDRHLELTEPGRAKATRVMRKHRLAERLLLDVIGLEWEFVHDEACRWEHVMSDRVERKLVGMLGDPRESPYGNPIPGLDELGGPNTSATQFLLGVRPMTTALEGTAGGVNLVVRRLGEPIQTDTALLADLFRVGLRPGALVSAQTTPGGVRVVGAGGGLDLAADAAGHVFVADPVTL